VASPRNERTAPDVNELGEVFTLGRANWFGGMSNANTGDEVLTATHNMSIIQPRRAVDTFSMV
jgi:hypothetical protein